MASTKNRQRLGYRRIVQLLVYLVIVPTGLILSVGIILLFFGAANLVFGLLTLSFVSALVTGVVLVLVFLRREANLSELQADFVSKVSHELRTPLTAIRLFGETLGRAEDETTKKQCLDALARETERLSDLIERLLDWGRMEAGRKQYDLKEEEVSAVIGQAVDAFATHRYGTDAVFSCVIAPGLPRVLVDRNAIADALVNLLSNALKYGGTPAAIEVRAFSVSKGVAIEVQDNGKGIPHPEHKRIFDKFYRIDDRLSRQREGSGLGLAIVKHIVRAHRARISLVSQEGKGTTFRITLDSEKALSTSPATSGDEARTNPTET